MTTSGARRRPSMLVGSVAEPEREGIAARPVADHVIDFVQWGITATRLPSKGFHPRS